MAPEVILTATQLALLADAVAGRAIVCDGLAAHVFGKNGRALRGVKRLTIDALVTRGLLRRTGTQGHYEATDTAAGVLRANKRRLKPPTSRRPARPQAATPRPPRGGADLKLFNDVVRRLDAMYPGRLAAQAGANRLIRLIGELEACYASLPATEDAGTEPPFASEWAAVRRILAATGCDEVEDVARDMMAELFGCEGASGADQSGVCRRCGCTEERGCEGGCAWADAEHTLCTACAYKE